MKDYLDLRMAVRTFLDLGSFEVDRFILSSTIAGAGIIDHKKGK